MKERVLLIEDDDGMRAALTQSLELENITVLQANGLAQARRSIRANFPGVVLSDIRMPVHDGFEVLNRVKAVDADLPVIFLTGEADVPMAVRALRQGVYDFLEKPCGVDTLVAVIRRALRHRDLVLQARRLESVLEHSDAAAIHFPGNTAASAGLRKDLRRVAPLPVNVHFHGDPGVGKRLAAHTLNVLSGKRGGVVSINFERDPAPEDWPDAPAATVAVAILKNVETLQSQNLGDLVAYLDALAPERVLTTGQRPLADLPLLAELSGSDTELIEIPVPNLLQRSADLPVIFENLARQVARNLDIDLPALSPQTISAVASRAWRGNLPELRTMARDVVLDLSSPSGAKANQGLAEQMRAFEENILIETLKRNGGKASKTAEELKLPRKTLYDKLAKYGIEPRRLKPPSDG